MATIQTTTRRSSSGSGFIILLLLIIVGFQAYYINTGHWPSWAAGTISKASNEVHKETAEMRDTPALNSPTPVTTTRSISVNTNNSDSTSTDIQQLGEKIDKVVAQSVHTIKTFADSTGLNAALQSDPNLREESDHYTLNLDIPNADKSTINVNVDGRILTISGTRQKSATTNQQRGITNETESSSFLRSVLLPPRADSTRVQAKYDNQTLSVTIPKLQQPSSGTQVQVQ